MAAEVSKSQFKARALHDFREVQRTGEAVVITDHGRPVLKLVPFEEEPDAALDELRESVVRYDAPTEPVALDDWEDLG